MVHPHPRYYYREVNPKETPVSITISITINFSDMICNIAAVYIFVGKSERHDINAQAQHTQEFTDEDSLQIKVDNFLKFTSTFCVRKPQL